MPAKPRGPAGTVLASLHPELSEALTVKSDCVTSQGLLHTKNHVQTPYLGGPGSTCPGHTPLPPPLLSAPLASIPLSTLPPASGHFHLAVLCLDSSPRFPPAGFLSVISVLNVRTTIPGSPRRPLETVASLPPVMQWDYRGPVRSCDKVQFPLQDGRVTDGESAQSDRADIQNSQGLPAGLPITTQTRPEPSIQDDRQGAVCTWAKPPGPHVPLQRPCDIGTNCTSDSSAPQAACFAAFS